MHTPQTIRRLRQGSIARTALAAVALLITAPAAFGQLTDIASNPLTTSAPNQVKPNLMFILDDSGSMGSDYMPDDVINLAGGSYGRNASQCNGLAYNPNSTYQVPVDATGADLAAGTYTFPSPASLNNIRSISSGAPTIGTGSFTVTLSSGSSGSYTVGMTVTLYSNSNATGQYMVGTVTAWNGSTRDITVNVTETLGSGSMASPRIGNGDARPFYFTYSGTQPALAYTYTTSGVITSTTFYQQCNSAAGSLPAVFTRVVVTPSTITQNYRNWYTYYRTRMQMAKAATALAFRTIGDRFRVGYTTISSNYVNGSDFLNITDFDATQKASFYTALNSAAPGRYTPLRGALSKAGRYYARMGFQSDGTAQSYDPVQFSCQKNFAILTTDGYWNTQEEVNSTTWTSYGPDRLNRTDVGQQDAFAPRPLYDGATVTVRTRTSNLQQRTTTSQIQTATVQLQQSTGTLQTRTSGNSGSTWSSWSNTSSCTWDNGGSSRRQCRYNYGGWSNTSSCTVSGNTGTSGTWSITSAVQCQYTAPTWTNAASCTPSTPPPSGSSPYTVASATLCQTVTNTTAWANVSSCTAGSGVDCQYTGWSSWSNVSSCTAEAQSTASPYTVGTARECQSTISGGSSNSLADVAMYYYETDLRTTALGNCTLASGTNVCTNNVPPRGTDNATHQHMSTFTVGMGVSGTLGYANNYLAGGSADYQAIIQGTRDWPVPNGGAANIDDLWHAAVNGRGQYFNAGDPSSLALGLTNALAAIDAQTGSGSGAAASTLQPVAGDNYLFIAKYTTVHWTGELVARTIDPQTGVISNTDSWSAEQLLDARVAAGTARNIYYMQRSGSANTGTLRSFTYSNLNADGLGGNFSNACSKAVPLTQCSDSGYDTAGANSGANMVEYLRGTYFPIYRNRQHILGDIVGGAPVYVRRPPFQYTENNYATFVTNNASRTGVVYVAANDGMLHAFNGATGQEMWAYVPTMVMDRMYRLADNDYANRHEFFVNGAPVVGDIWVPGSPGQWKTILVGGLGAGGRGYYAIDITNPNSPQALWEFTNDSLGGASDLGLSFGNPVITKRADGTWVVAFTSGYNNVSPGDGNGRLFVVNANTGERLMAIETFTSTGVTAGSTTTPSGLGKLNAWVESTIDNTARRFYAGDLLGNLWRFDIDGLVAPTYAALRLAYLQAGTPDVPQPITTQPALGLVDYAGTEYPVVYVGTGRMLGLSDLSSTAQQTIYAIKDPLTNTPLGDVHASSSFVTQTLSQTSSTSPRTITNNAVDWTTANGWRVDLIGTGERVNVDMQVIFQSLTVATNTPNNDACTAGGSSYLYNFNLATGSAPAGSGSNVVGTWLGGTLVVGMSYLTLQQAGSTDPGTGRTITVIIDNRGVPRTDDVPPPPPPPATGRRTSWRELVN